MSATTACTSPYFAKLRARFVELFRIAAGDQHAHAFLEKLARGLVADAARAAGDDGAATVDSQIHAFPPRLTLLGRA